MPPAAEPAAALCEVAVAVNTPVGELNWLDLVLLALLLIFALDGVRRGLLLGALDLLGAAAGFGLGIVVERPAGDRLAQALPALSPPLAHLSVFLAVLVVVQMLIGASVGRLLVAVVVAMSRTPLGGLDRLLGLLPGFVRGVITVTLFLLPFALVPWLPSISQGIEQSTLGNQLVGSALQLMPIVEASLGQDLQGGLAGFVTAPPEAESDTVKPLPLGPPSGDLVPDADAEQRMLDLLNGERSRVGLKPLAADERLRAVARAHSLEMFQLDY